MSLDGDEGCYFHRQPKTPAEVDEAIRALFVSCVGACRYGGDDPTIRRRLAELGHAHLCDHPLEGHPIVHRNHARFTLVRCESALEVARLLAIEFQKIWASGRTTSPPAGDSERADFEHLRLEQSDAPRRYVVERSPRGWLVIAVAAPSAPMWLHDVLVALQATDVRWFSSEEWATKASGSELPY